MSRPLPVNLLMAGTGAVLLVSGIGGESIGGVLKGNFGNLSSKKPAATATASDTGLGAIHSVNSGEVGGEGQESEIESLPSPSTFAPSPDTFHKRVSPQEEARSIAGILLSEGIKNPTDRQIEEARELYHRK